MLYILYVSICNVLFHSAYTINNKQPLFVSISIVPEGLYCSIHSYGIQSKDT